MMKNEELIGMLYLLTTLVFVFTAYLRRDRIDRNAISLNDPSSSLGSSSGITRSQSMRTRMRNGELESRIEEKSNGASLTTLFNFV